MVKTILVSWGVGCAVVAGWGGEARAECPLASCTITFDATCPSVAELCGAQFSGGNGCVIDFLPFCYSTGLQSYRIDPGSPLTITLSGDLVDLEVFFANVTGSSGEMHFFNAANDEVGTPLFTNGDCAAFMPVTQSQVFGEGVRTIEVTASGGQVYIDTFVVNAGFTPPLGDLDGDCAVGINDFLILLAKWGPCPDPCPPSCAADFDGNCAVGITDFLILLANWG